VLLLHWGCGCGRGPLVCTEACGTWLYGLGLLAASGQVLPQMESAD
jgi:hypothetical protein